MPSVVCTILPLALSLSVALGCGGSGEQADAQAPQCGSSQLTYANFGDAFLIKYCNGCHGFTSSDAQADPTLLIDVAVTGTSMPPTTPLPSPAERTELGTWLACGAP